MHNLYIVVPVYDESLNLLTLFEAFRRLDNSLSEKFNLLFLLIDDGSTDGTAELAVTLADNLNLEVLIHPINRGPGAAFATAFIKIHSYILATDWVITMEGDNTSRIELIQQMIHRTQEGFDIVLASPYMYGGGFTQTSFLRKFLSSGANLLVKDLLDIQGILTVSSFFRLYSGNSIIKLQKSFGPGIVERVGFESMVEMVMKMTMLKLSISEVAMQLDSSMRKGKSKMKIMRTIRGYFSLWLKKKEWQKNISL
jgi:dolichol-phosphate mannosyltransferase